MRKDTYRIGDGTFAFSPAVFDSLLGHGAKGAARMRELAGAMHVSISSIKDWRRGTHAPSGFEKVEDIACWAHIDVADLLIESGDRTMDEKLTENQLDVLCVLWNQAYDFLDLCEETDHFVWPTTDLRCVPDSILHDIKVNPEDDKSRPPWEIGTEDLFLQTLDVYLRACRRATPYVGESDIFVRLLGLCDIMTETAFGEDDGKARDIANRFETAVFLIAYGIAEKDGLYEADPHRYPYSQAFRHGMNILAALCAECSDDAEELLPTFNESDFIRNSAASDVREWTARWRDECREAVEGCRSIEIGPLASVDGDYFAATSECYEVLRFAENDLLGGHQERRVYEFLRAGTQEQYVYGRRMLIRHPLLTWNEYVRIKTGLALGDPDPLDQGEADTIDPVWLQEFVSMAYEPVPGAAKVCPSCGWTMTMRGKQPHCSSATCAKAVTGDFDKLDSVAHDAFRLSRGVMHYISSPGKLELAIAEAAAGLGLKYEMWPLKDTCDILIHLPDGRQLAVDAKAYGRAERLAREIEDDTGIAQMCADEVAYVVPDQVERDHPGYRALCNAVLRGKTGYSCETLRNFSKRLDAAAKGGTR